MQRVAKSIVVDEKDLPASAFTDKSGDDAKRD